MTKQQKITLARIAVGILILALIAGNVYFANKAQHTGYEIAIGRANLAPVMDDGKEIGKTLAVDFTKSKPLKESSQVTTVLFALLGAEPIEAPALPEEPDAGLMLLDKAMGVALNYSLWLTEDSIILGVGPQNELQYREIKDDMGLREMVQQQLRAYGG